ncbi:hypothetical protein SCE1572_39280 [Sorangium cellulosum So0157-2]|uniref:Uncharacterized protein n=1 Tax=Sorangium cellulosum So0157-2 TaxID=1254432 RepID=S4Y5E1_SORCE|nr:hypothetical protein SCE1572_39280 [Sorangium cellulosum So0157-2]
MVKTWAPCSTSSIPWPFAPRLNTPVLTHLVAEPVTVTWPSQTGHVAM